MSKENGWAEERAFYIEYGCIELTDERSGKQISDCNMMDADWSIPWLRFRTPPKIQALIEERDLLIKNLDLLRKQLAQETKENTLYCMKEYLALIAERDALAKENEALRQSASPSAYTLYNNWQSSLDEIAVLEKENAALLGGNKKLQSKLSKLEVQKIPTPTLNNLIYQICEQSLLTGVVNVKIMAHDEMYQVAKEDKSINDPLENTVLRQVTSQEYLMPTPDPKDDLVHRTASSDSLIAERDRLKNTCEELIKQNKKYDEIIKSYELNGGKSVAASLFSKPQENAKLEALSISTRVRL